MKQIKKIYSTFALISLLSNLIIPNSNAAPSGGGGQPQPAPTSAPTETPTIAPSPIAKTLESQLNSVLSLIGEKNWIQAEITLRELRDSNSKSADVWNLSGYVARNSSNLEGADAFYRQALLIDAKHLGALEYQGELFLTLNKLGAARRNLAQLKILCGGKCEEYRDLNRAIKASLKTKKKR